MNRRTMPKGQGAALAAAMLVMALAAAAMLVIGGGCSAPRDEETTIDGGTDDAGSSVVGDVGARGSDGGSVHLGGDSALDFPRDGGDASPDAGTGLAGDDAKREGGPRDLPDGPGSRTCAVSVQLERCGTSDVYRCRVVSDDPTLTNDLHVSGCNAPDGTACARCCPGEPAYACPAVTP